MTMSGHDKSYQRPSSAIYAIHSLPRYRTFSVTTWLYASVWLGYTWSSSRTGRSKPLHRGERDVVGWLRFESVEHARASVADRQISCPDAEF